MDKVKVIIIGAGAHGRVILDALQLQGEAIVVGFIDDSPELVGRDVDGIKVIGTSADLERFKAIATHGVVGVGDNITRALLFKRLLGVGLIPFNVIHPSAIIAKRVQIGRGVVILAGAVVNTGSRIGDNVCINTAASIDHDNVLEESTHIFPGAHLAGGVTVKRYSYVGTGAAVNPYLTIGENVIIGSGAAVCEDIPDNVIVVGVPARITKRREGSNT